MDVHDRSIGWDFLDLGDGVGALVATAQEGVSIGCDFHYGETLVWIFCWLGNAMKDFVVIS
jgi:hypothetical protein